MQYCLEYQSHISCSKEDAWRWVTSFDGISKEIPPGLKLSVPPGVSSIDDVNITLGKPMFRASANLFGFIPLLFSNLTLIELDNKNGFVERSEMSMMNLWQHERKIVEDTDKLLIKDKLTFEPKMLKSLTYWVVDQLFQYRHRQLKRWLTDDYGKYKK